ncbi:hypothetical protein [Paenibacillus aceti]|uniref:hypothetical protein n=1 Tax=Paenibacillus aceti TaxID=1820010 RepID=UPI0013C4D93A|nr:hypothetical protein [Paenibacillus aceti]
MPAFLATPEPSRFLDHFAFFGCSQSPAWLAIADIVGRFGLVESPDSVALLVPLKADYYLDSLALQGHFECFAFPVFFLIVDPLRLRNYLFYEGFSFYACAWLSTLLYLLAIIIANEAER